MAYNFLRGDHDQPYLLPPDLRDWLPQDHLAWFVRDVVDQLDLAPFLRAYRADGHGHPAYDPKTLLGVLLYAYATGVRSSRQIQRRWTPLAPLLVRLRVLWPAVPPRDRIASTGARNRIGHAGGVAVWERVDAIRIEEVPTVV